MEAKKIGGQQMEVTEMEQVEVVTLYTVLRDASLTIGSHGRSGQVAGVGHYMEGFLGQFGGKTEYRCRRCGKLNSHTIECLKNRRGRRPAWRQTLVKDGSVTLTYHSRTSGLGNHNEFIARRNDQIARATEVLESNGYTVSRVADDQIKVTR